MKLAIAAAALAATMMTFGAASAETTIIKKRHTHRHGPRIVIRDGHRHHHAGAKVVIKHSDM